MEEEERTRESRRIQQQPAWSCRLDEAPIIRLSWSCMISWVRSA